MIVRLLLDTHAFLWFAAGDARLSSRARRRIEDPGNDKFLSVASVWEIAIKTALERSDFRVEPEQVLAMAADIGFEPLHIAPAHAIAVRSLAKLHRDPFDRMLLAQAQIEPMILITCDRVLAEYGDWVRLV